MAIHQVHVRIFHWLCEKVALHGKPEVSQSVQPSPCSLGFVCLCFMSFIYFFPNFIFKHSPYLSFQIHYLLPLCVFYLCDVCLALISFTFPSLPFPSVFSLCVPLSQCQVCLCPCVKRSSLFPIASSASECFWNFTLFSWPLPVY